MTNETLDHLAKRLFWFNLFLCLIVIFFLAFQKIHDLQEYQQSQQDAQSKNNPILCENIKNLRYSAQCYSTFISQGYDCRTQDMHADACLLVQGVFLKNDTFCDAAFPEEKLPLNLECRVSVFIERYTNEGLRDCCHIQ
jgi:isochorismate hydrolase